MVQHFENLLLNTITKNFASRLLSQGSIAQDYPSKIVKKFSFGEFKRNINFSTEFSAESDEKPTIHDLLFLVAAYSPKNDNKHPSEMRN